MKQAERMYFIATQKGVFSNYITFDFNSGFSESQKKKNVVNMHKRIGEIKDYPILEVSTKSDNEFGKKLSAFNLKLDNYALEVVFQASKRFKCTQDFFLDFDDLMRQIKILNRVEFDIEDFVMGGSVYCYNKNSIECKRNDIIYFDFYSMGFSPKDCKQFISAFLKKYKDKVNIYEFVYQGNHFDLSVEINGQEIKTLFYDYIYFKALQESFDAQEMQKLLKFNIFTDVEFNHKKSVNCQARSCALYHYALENNRVKYYLQNQRIFKEIYRQYEDTSKKSLLF